MPVKLTQKEKNLRGTAQKCRVSEVRSLRVIRKDIRDVKRLISDMSFNLGIARKSLRADGALIEVLVTNSNGNFEKTRRLNPTFKVQRDALTAVKTLNRQLSILREEETQALANKEQADTRSEFAVD